MELCDIYYGFWEGMKEISVGVCLNDYTWLEIWKKKKVDCSERPSEKEKKKRKGSWTKEKKMKKKKEKKNRSAIWTLLCKVSGIGIIWKEKLCSTSL